MSKEDDLESAYGSESTSSSFFIDKPQNEQNISIPEEERTTENVWFQWIENRVKRYKIFKVIVLLLMVYLIFKISSMDSQYEKDQERISQMEKEVQRMEDYIRLGLPSEEPLHRKITEAPPTTEFVLPTHVFQTTPEPFTTTFQPQEPIPTHFTDPIIDSSRFNAANYLLGASVDIELSSNSNLNSNIWRDQSDLVLLDRPEPPVDRQWCTFDKNPVITVNLAKAVRPIAVSYQHSKWEGKVPNGAPKRFDVYRCIDSDCSLKYLLSPSKCEYKSNSYNIQEQFCHIENRLSDFKYTVSKVQFHFYENHGNTDKTCISLIRFFGEEKNKKKIPKIGKERTIDDARSCFFLQDDFHNYSFLYQMSRKNCWTLYQKGCCNECPECCQDCLIVDFNWTHVGRGILGLLLLMLFIFLIVLTAGCFGFLDIRNWLPSCLKAK